MQSAGRDSWSPSCCAPSLSQVVGRRKHREKRILTRKEGRRVIRRKKKRERKVYLVEVGGGREESNRVKRRKSGRAKKRRVKAPGEVTYRPRPSHSPAHPDYPTPGAGRSVMSIEEVLNLGLVKFSCLYYRRELKKSFDVLWWHNRFFSQYYTIYHSWYASSIRNFIRDWISK